MEIRKSDVVRAVAGRDEGMLFFVIDKCGEFVKLANGKQRRLEKPKNKKLKHIEYVCSGDNRTGEKLRNGDKVTNNDLRRALASLNAEPDEEKGGM